MVTNKKYSNSFDEKNLCWLILVNFIIKLSQDLSELFLCFINFVNLI